MTTDGWEQLHQDVIIDRDANHVDMSMVLTMTDKSHVGRVVRRVMPFKSLPLEQGELVLDDYICSIYELMYHEIKVKRGEKKL